MKKILNTILLLVIVTVLVLPAGSAQAVGYQNINWLTFANKLEDYLWAWRNKTGKCEERSPSVGGCLADFEIDSVLNQLMDPNDDKNTSDSYFIISDPAKRINYLTSTKDNRYYLSVVLQFEKSVSPPYWISMPSIKGSQIGDVNNKFFQSFYGALAGDNLIASLLFEIDQESNPPTLEYFPRERNYFVNTNDLYRIYYETARMTPYQNNCGVADDPIIKGDKICTKKGDWTPDEQSSLSEARNTIDQARKYLQSSKISPTKALKAVQALNYDSSKVKGMSVLTAFQPNGFSVAVGSRKVDISSADILRIFRFFSESSLAIRYQSLTKNIAAGASLIDKSEQGQMTDLDTILSNMVKNDTYVASGDYVFHEVTDQLGVAGVTVWSPPPLRIYFIENEISSRNYQPGSLTVHEVLHYLRYKVDSIKGISVDSDKGMFDEAFTDYLTRQILAQNGIPGNPGMGYYTRVYFKNIVARLASQNNWTQNQAVNYLETNYFHSPFALIDTVTKPGFEEQLNTDLDKMETVRDALNNAGTPAEHQAALSQFNQLDKQIKDYIKS